MKRPPFTIAVEFTGAELRAVLKINNAGAPNFRWDEKDEKALDSARDKLERMQAIYDVVLASGLIEKQNVEDT